MHIGENLLLKQIVLTEAREFQTEGKQLCFVFVKQGKCRYLTEHISHVLSSGDWLVFPESTGGKVDPMDKESTTAVGFLVGLEQLSSLLSPSEICLFQKVSARLANSRHFPASSAMARQCQALLDSAPAQASLEHRSQLLRIAAAILSEEFKLAKEQHPQASHGRGEFANVLNRLSLEDVQDLSIEDLAKKLGYSRRHLNRLFHEHMGISASDLKMEVRLLKSLILLKNSSTKVIDVAMECGFNHLGLFSQCFKRRFGVSPNHWRQQALPRGGGKSPAEIANQDCHLSASGMCLWKNLKGNGPLATGPACQVPIHPALCHPPVPPSGPRVAA